MSSSQQSDDDAVSQRVITAVASARDEDPLELPPLYDAIDPDALDQLFDHGFAGTRAGPGRAVFEVAGCEVTVHSDGEVDVTAPDERTPPSTAVHPVDEQDEAEARLD